MGRFDYRTCLAAALIVRARYLTGKLVPLLFSLEATDRKAMAGQDGVQGWSRTVETRSLSPHENGWQRLNDLVVSAELLFQTFHLVLQAELQLLQLHFLEFLVLREIFLLDQIFEALLVLRMFLRKLAELIVTLQKLIAYLSCHSMDLRRDAEQNASTRRKAASSSFCHETVIGSCNNSASSFGSR